jgi:hypothetical protein
VHRAYAIGNMLGMDANESQRLFLNGLRQGTVFAVTGMGGP